MPLRIWLPLTENTENQGLTNSTVTASNVTSNASGKIGKCYSFNGTNSYIMGTNPPLNNSSEEFTYCCWLKLNSLSSDQCLYSNRSNSTPGGASIAIFYGTGNYIYVHNGVSQKLVLSTTISTGIWYHISITRKANDKIKVYINGTLDAYLNTTTTVPTTANATRYTIGASQKTSTTIYGSYLDGYLNDVRIYDHVLNEKVISEIAKGLIVHLPLNGNGRGANNLYDFESLASKWTADGTTLSNYVDDAMGNVLKVTTGSSLTSLHRIYRSVSNLWTSGQTYTVSFMARASKAAVCNMSRSAVNYSPNFSITTSWNKYYGTITSTETATGGTLSFHVNTTSCDVYITNIKLESGTKLTPYMPGSNDPHYTSMGYGLTTEYDLSGNCYSGVKAGTVTYSNDTANYGVSTVFNGTNTRINCYNSYHVDGSLNISFSCWANATDYSENKWKYFISSQQSGGIVLGHYSGTTARGRVSAYTKSNLSSYAYIDADYEIALTGWHMFTCTYNTSAIKLYIDGELVKTTTKTTYGVHFNSGAYMFLGAESTGTGSSDYYSGKLSDVRIYYTTLTSDQVMDLYLATKHVLTIS